MRISACGGGAAKVVLTRNTAVAAATDVPSIRSTSTCTAAGRWRLVGGDTYRIGVVATRTSATPAPFTLDVDPEVRATNDEPATAAPLPHGALVKSTTAAASMRAGEHGPADSDGSLTCTATKVDRGTCPFVSVWYRYRAPRTGTLRVDARSGGRDHWLWAATTPSRPVRGLSYVEDGDRMALRFPVRRGRSYLVQVVMSADEVGAFTLRTRFRR